MLSKATTLAYPRQQFTGHTGRINSVVSPRTATGGSPATGWDGAPVGRTDRPAGARDLLHRRVDPRRPA